MHTPFMKNVLGGAPIMVRTSRLTVHTSDLARCDITEFASGFLIDARIAIHGGLTAQTEPLSPSAAKSRP